MGGGREEGREGGLQAVEKLFKLLFFTATKVKDLCDFVHKCSHVRWRVLMLCYVHTRTHTEGMLGVFSKVPRFH